MKDRLLSPEAVDLFVREYQTERDKIEREARRSRSSIEQEIGKQAARIENLGEAIANGGGAIPVLLQKITAAKSAQEMAQRELDQLESEKVVRLHPAIAADYRRQVACLESTLCENDDIEPRNKVAARMRALIDAVVVTPATSGRGVAT